MRALLIGGTGLISRGIIKHLQSRGAKIVMFNRAQRANPFAGGEVEQITGDRNDFAAFEKTFASEKYDVVIDMVCFNPQQAESVVLAFSGRCEQLIFCSTVCTYGAKIPPTVLVDETFPQEPISEYGRNKVACEKVFLDAHAKGAFKTTIIRPSCTYGPGGRLIDNLEFNPPTWDRIERGMPVLCSGDGLGLWVATHRDDCGKLFAYAAMNPKTYGQSYNATRDENFTWQDFYREAAEAIGKRAKVVFMPASWIIAHDPQRFSLLREITQVHGAYSSEKAKRDVPEFRCEISFDEGAKQTLTDIRRRKEWRNTDGDEVYESMIRKALAAGMEPAEL